MFATPPVVAKSFQPANSTALLDVAFACGPSDFAGNTSSVPLRDYGFGTGGRALFLPTSWDRPERVGQDAIQARSPDKKIRIRWTREVLYTRTFEQAVAVHEGRYFGHSRLSAFCDESLELRYGPVGVPRDFRAYRARYAYRGNVSVYVLFFQEEGRFNAFVLETEWSRRRTPPFEVIDGILRQFARPQ